MKNIFIVGSRGALGGGVARVLMRENYDRFYLIERKPVNIDKDNVNLLLLEDITSPENAERVFGSLNLAENSENFLFSTVGGFLGGKSIRKTDYAEWRKMFELNVNSAFLTAKYFLKNVPEKSTGSILFTSALSSFAPQADKAAYNGSKSALNFLVQTLASEEFTNGYSVNAIAPYIIDTPENRLWVSDSSKMTSPESIGKLVHNLFENYRIISGNIIKLPGTISTN